MTKNEVLKGLQPEGVFRFFEEILAVPRPSKQEAKMTEYLMNWAEARDIEHFRDEIGNVIMRKGATSGMESRPWVCLQAHMDMVCEKNSDKTFDFSKDSIVPKIENGWLMAEGTTLGADDGIGVAAALAVLDANDIAHGPIECLFTVDEETGLSGAEALSADALKSRILLNLDSEDEGEIFIGCAGGVDTLAKLPFDKEDTPQGAYFRIYVKGLKGGHSGDDINKGLGCANKLLNRILWAADKEMDMRLAKFDGGNLRNAIAREAYAEVVVMEQEAEDLKQLVEKFARELNYEFRTTEPSLVIGIETIQKPKFVVDMLSQDNLLNVLYACPHGVLAMSREIPNFVETSTNLASVKTMEDHFFITTSQRSSVESAKEAAASRVESCFLLAGAEVEHTDGYPGWSPNTESYVLKVAVEAYKKLFGKEPVVRAIHAGLECGLIGEKYQGMDMISYGPTLRGVHSPEERLEIATVELFWKHTLEILKNI